MPEAKYCPTCGSAELKQFPSIPHLWGRYECRGCGYVGALVVTNGELARKIRDKWKRVK